MQPSTCSINAEPDGTRQERDDVVAEMRQLWRLRTARLRQGVSSIWIDARICELQARRAELEAELLLHDKPGQDPDALAATASGLTRRAGYLRAHATTVRRGIAPTIGGKAQRTRPRIAAPRERRDSSSSRTSGQDPGDDDSDDGPWALSFVDRAPFLWRFRAARCRYMEWRDGVVE